MEKYFKNGLLYLFRRNLFTVVGLNRLVKDNLILDLVELQKKRAYLF